MLELLLKYKCNYLKLNEVDYQNAPTSKRSGKNASSRVCSFPQRKTDCIFLVLLKAPHRRFKCLRKLILISKNPRAFCWGVWPVTDDEMRHYASVICGESFCATFRSVFNKKLPYQCSLSSNHDQYIRGFYKSPVNNGTTLEAVCQQITKLYLSPFSSVLF